MMCGYARREHPERTYRPTRGSASAKRARRSGLNSLLIPSRNARDVQNAGDVSLGTVSGRNTSPIALIFNCGLFRKDAVIPTSRPTAAGRYSGSVTELLAARCVSRVAPCDRNKGSGSARRPKTPADNAKPPARLNATVWPIPHRGISLPRAGRSHQLELLIDSIDRPLGSGTVSLKVEVVGEGPARELTEYDLCAGDPRRGKTGHKKAA